MSHILIVWASFAWLSAYLVLRKRLWRSVKITLVDMQDRFTYTPGLHETLLDGESLENLQFSLSDIYGADFKQAKVEHISADHLCTFASWEQERFDYVVIATWSRTNYFGKKDFESHCYALRHPWDVKKLNTILPEAKNIVVIGGGVTGVEIASILSQRVTPEQHITLVHSRAHTFDTFHENVGQWTEDRLRKHNVSLELGNRATETTDTTVTLKSWKVLPSDCTILSSWIKINDELYCNELSFDLDYAALESGEFFVCWDCALHGLYATAHNAMVEGRHVWDRIADLIQNKTVIYDDLPIRKEVAIALWARDGIVTNNHRWWYLPYLTGFVKKVVEKRVMAEFTYKILLPL